MSSARVPGKWRAAAIYTVLTLLLAYPLSLRPDRIAWANDPDEHLVMWLLAWDSHAFLHHPLSIFDANTFYPEHRTLAYQENLIGSAFFAAPVLWLTGNPVLATNFVSLLACVLCGLGAYVLARRVGMGETAAVLCGVVFAFSPPRFLRFPQTHLAVVQWIPFSLASLHAYLEGGRRRDLLLAVAFFTLQVLSSGHAGVFLVVAILVMLAYRLVLGEPILLEKRVRDIGIAGALLIVPAVLFVIPYRINQAQMGLRRGLGSWDTVIEDFFASPTRVDVFLQSLITDRNINGVATAWLFPGFLPVGLALVAVIVGGAALARHVMWPAPAPPRSRAAAKEAADDRAPVLIFVMTAIAWALLGVARPALHAGDGLAARSYGNDRIVRTGYITVGESGLYNFGVTADDTSRLSIDNFLVIDHGDHGSDRPNSPKTGSARLSAGLHRVLLEYVQPTGHSPLEWLWARDGDWMGYQRVPSWALSQRPVAYPVAMIVRTIDAVRLVSLIVAGFAAMWFVSVWVNSRRDAWIAWGAPYRRNPTAFYLLLTLTCVALALGPPYGPWRYVYSLPGFNFIRGSSRFMVMGLLGIAVLAAIGFERLTARLSLKGQAAVAGVVIVLMAAEFAAQPFSTPYTVEIPAADQWVAGQPKPFVVAEVPSSGGYQRFQTMYMLHSMAHWQKTVAGYGGIEPEIHSVLYQELDSFPDVRSLQHLRELDVTYVIVHIDLYPAAQWSEVDQRLHSFDGWLSLKYSDPGARVYALRRPQETTRVD